MAVELVTLFPTFMTLVAQTGVIVLFYAEVFAFFLEILALVLYVYYWNSFRSRYVHWAVSIFVAAGTIASAVLITMVNAWMNTPNGFDTATFVSSGFKTVSGVQPWAVFLTPSTVSEVFHVLPTTVLAGSMIIGSFFAYWFLRSRDAGEKEMFGKALKILGAIGIVMIALSGLTGANEIATLLTGQPLKFAALEANPINGTNLPEKLFGGVVNGTFAGGIIIPGAQSLLAQLETGITALPGLSQYSRFDLATVAGPHYLRLYGSRRDGLGRVLLPLLCGAAAEEEALRVQVLALPADPGSQSSRSWSTCWAGRQTKSAVSRGSSTTS